MNDIQGQLDNKKGQLGDMKGQGNFWWEPPYTGTANCLNTTEPPCIGQLYTGPPLLLGPWSNISVQEVHQIIFFLVRKESHVQLLLYSV